MCIAWYDLLLGAIGVVLGQRVQTQAGCLVRELEACTEAKA